MPDWTPGDGLTGATILLGVTGGIAAYKAADLASKLVQAGAEVHACLSDGAREFIRPMTFQALTGNPVYRSVFAGWESGRAGHVTLAAEADLAIVAPATANTIAKLAQGCAEDMLQATLLATRAPILVAPAMETHMWEHPATQANLATLRDRGVIIIDLEGGRLASGATGAGRLAALPALLGAIRQALGQGGPLHGRTVLVTAGGTHEAIDPVRFIANASSGQMGVAIAEAAVDAGARVIVIAGPTVQQLPVGCEIRRVTSAQEMEQAVHTAVPQADILIMAAAVADYRPTQAADHKLKKVPGQTEMTLTLTRNPDILAGIDGQAIMKVGFAAETDDLLTNARQKLAAKQLAIIVANDAIATIGSDHVQPTLILAGQPEPRPLPRMAKTAFAKALLQEIIHRYREGAPW